MSNFTNPLENCTQIAPNGYTCLDGEFNTGAAIGSLLFLIVFVVISTAVIRMTQRPSDEEDEEYKQDILLKRTRTASQVAAAVGRMRALRKNDSSPSSWDEGDADSIRSDVMSYGLTLRRREKQRILRDQYLDSLDQDERMWYDAVYWLRWRWLYDGVRILGTFFLVSKLFHLPGALGDIQSWNWAAVLFPYLVLDIVALYGFWMQSGFYRFFVSERIVLGLYTALVGFPLGTVLKILAIVYLESSGEPFNPNWFFVLVVICTSFTMLVIVLWSCFGKTFGPYQVLFGVGVTLFMAYVALCFVSMLRLIWPSEADRHMGEDDYDYDRSVWVLAPTSNVFQGGMVVFLTLGTLMTIVCTDFWLSLVHPKGPFEKSRKFGNLVTIIGISIFISCAVYQFDVDNRGGYVRNRDNWLVIPLFVMEGIILLHLIWTTIYMIRNRPEKIVTSHSAMDRELAHKFSLAPSQRSKAPHHTTFVTRHSSSTRSSPQAHFYPSTEFIGMERLHGGQSLKGQGRSPPYGGGGHQRSSPPYGPSSRTRSPGMHSQSMKYGGGHYPRHNQWVSPQGKYEEHVSNIARAKARSMPAHRASPHRGTPNIFIEEHSPERRESLKIPAKDYED